MTDETLDYLVTLNFNEPTPYGVLLILNVETGVGLINSVLDLTAAVERTFTELKEGLCPIRDFQYSFDLHGIDKFTFVVLERTSDPEREQTWRTRLKHIKILNCAASSGVAVEEHASSSYVSSGLSLLPALSGQFQRFSLLLAGPLKLGPFRRKPAERV